MTPCGHKCKSSCKHKCAWCEHMNTTRDNEQNGPIRNLNETLDQSDSDDDDDNEGRNASDEVIRKLAKAINRQQQAATAQRPAPKDAALHRRLKKLPNLDDTNSIIEVTKCLRAAEACHNSGNYVTSFEALTEMCSGTDDNITDIVENASVAYGTNVNKEAWIQTVNAILAALFTGTTATELMTEALASLPGRARGVSLADYYAPFRKMLQDATWLRKCVFGTNAIETEWQKYQAQLWLTKINAPWTALWTSSASTLQQAFEILKPLVNKQSLDEAAGRKPAAGQLNIHEDRASRIQEQNGSTSSGIDASAAAAIKLITKTSQQAQQAQQDALNLMKDQHADALRALETKTKSVIDELQHNARDLQHDIRTGLRRHRDDGRNGKSACARCPSPTSRKESAPAAQHAATPTRQLRKPRPNRAAISEKARAPAAPLAATHIRKQGARQPKRATSTKRLARKTPLHA
jgi:hypothetical protein